MPTSHFPNQRNITIHKETPSAPYLSISKKVMFDAYKNIDNAYAFSLYLYLASNANGYSFDLSPANVHLEFGMPESTCRDQIRRLKEKGYIVEGENNVLEFYEKPNTSAETMNPNTSAETADNKKSKNEWRF